MKVGILTCSTLNRQWLYDVTNKMKYDYCSNKKDIEFLFSIVYYDTTIAPGWNKVRYILDNLSNYDYVIWMDDDASFIRNDFDFVDFIEKNCDADKSIFMAKDCNGLNSGIMIVKNSKDSFDMLNYLWNNRSALYEICKKKGYMEQPAIVNYVNTHPNIFKEIDGKIVNAYDERIFKSKINQRCKDTAILHIARGVEYKEKTNHDFLLSFLSGY